MPNRMSFTDHTLAELTGIFRKENFPAYRAEQAAGWVYKKLAFSLEKMTDLPPDVKAFLSGNFQVIGSTIERVFKSKLDSTVKFLVKLADGNYIEAVFMAEAGGKSTACISTQAGCPIRCAFCVSGRNGLKRNLTVGEIVEQVLLVNAYCRDNAPSPDVKAPQARLVRNIVIMGMGEPLLNTDNLLKALEIIIAKWGLGMGLNRITLSTAICPREQLDKLVKAKLMPNLAVSLHTADDKLRKNLVPHCKAGIAEIVRNAEWYRSASGKELTFEYVLLRGVNSSVNDAEALARLLKRCNAKVNLIVVNAVKDSEFSPPPEKDVLKFQSVLTSAGIMTFIRQSRGKDISAACGQLKNEK